MDTQRSQNQRGGYRNNRQDTSPPSILFNPDWIKKGADKKMIEFCEKWGKYLKEQKVSSSQLRNIYGEIMRIKLKGLKKEQASFYLLKPKMAYNASRIDRRNEKEAFNNLLKQVLFPALESVEIENEKTFDNFQKLFEALLAYHKYFGGK